MFGVLRHQGSTSHIIGRGVTSVSRTSVRKMTQNAHRPENWKQVAPPPLPGPAFAAQSVLPKLPVPELSETLVKLKQTLRPIAYDEIEYNEAVRKVDEFGSTIGPELQRRLVAHAKEREHWLEQWWDDLAYLGYRDSVSNTARYCRMHY